MPDNPVPISLVESDVLLAEVLGRFDHAVFAGTKRMVLPDPGNPNQRTKDVISRRFRGDPTTCMGLAELAKELCLAVLNQGSYDIDDEEDHPPVLSS